MFSSPSRTTSILGFSLLPTVSLAALQNLTGPGNHQMLGSDKPPGYERPVSNRSAAIDRPNAEPLLADTHTGAYLTRALLPSLIRSFRERYSG